ncbi:MAG: ATPase, T2SS/T4P/T4SS family [Clostridia bacterium]|nr:ATPase, T2SS/T4P/T4SS family [Clostridia bacterium]
MKKTRIFSRGGENIEKINEWLKDMVEYQKEADIISKEVKDALNNFSVGDSQKKEIIKTYILNLIYKENKIQEVYKYFNFDNDELMSVEDKFNLLLYSYCKRYGANAFIKIIEKYKLNLLRKKGNANYYYIDESDILLIYEKEKLELTKEDKVKISVQKIYSKYKGLGVIDELLSLNIDGISGGVSNKVDGFETVWIFYKGNMMHLEFLKFSNEELKRVCENLYRYNTLKQLSKRTGYVISKMKDGSRVVVARPEFGEDWMFFVRKFNITDKNMLDIITGNGSEDVVKILRFLVKGSRNIAITGQQGVGKTTLLTLLVEYIYDIYPIRIFETNFELNARKLYSNKNICSFQETEEICIKKALDFGKKTDGAVTIIGEVSNDQVAAHIIEIAQVASRFTIFTHHAKKFEHLVMSLRNSLINIGSFKNEEIAKEQVISILEFDVHIEKDFYGKRYISRITECIKLENDRYREINIVENEEGEFKFKNAISKEKTNEMMREMSKEDRDEFKYWIKSIYH